MFTLRSHFGTQLNVTVGSQSVGHVAMWQEGPLKKSLPFSHSILALFFFKCEIWAQKPAARRFLAGSRIKCATIHIHKGGGGGFCLFLEIGVEREVRRPSVASRDAQEVLVDQAIKPWLGLEFNEGCSKTILSRFMEARSHRMKHGGKRNHDKENEKREGGFDEGRKI